MKRMRILARISPAISIGVTLAIVGAAWLTAVANVDAGGGVGESTRARPKAKASPAEPSLTGEQEVPIFGINEDDDNFLVVDQIGKLNNLTPAHKVIALDIGGAELKKAGFDEKMTQWVQRGGIIWTHTDAAVLFGFRVQPIRNPLELEGRSVPITPWNGHLFTRNVDRVYYSMKSNSVYVVAHPRAQMLLRSVDNVVQRNPNLCVAAYFPLGRGSVIVMPPYVHTKRADGNAFFQAIRGSSIGRTLVANVPAEEIENLAVITEQAVKERDAAQVQRFLSGARSHLALWIALAYDRAGDKERTKAAIDHAVQVPGATPEVHRVAAELYNNLGDKDLAQAELAKAAGAREPRSEAAGLGLLITVDEIEEAEQQLTGPRRAAGVAGGGATFTPAAAAASLAQVFRGRLIFQLGGAAENLDRADRFFQTALTLDPSSPLANQYHALALATVGRSSRQPSQQRAILLMQASQFMGAAAGMDPTLPSSGTSKLPPSKGVQPAKSPGIGKATSKGTGKAAGDADASAAVGSANLEKWARQLVALAELSDAEPPVLRVAGDILVRSFPGDSVATVQQGVMLARQIAERMGFFLEEVEILSFPTQPLYTRYMRLADAPRGEFELVAGVVENKIATYLQATGPALPGKFGAGRAQALAPIIAHLYGHAVVNSLTEGGALVPGWLSEGIAAMMEPQRPNPMPILRAAQTQRLMFTAEEMNSQIDTVAADETRREVFQAQAHSIVDFLTRISPPGTLYRIIQEMGAGNSVDDALQKNIKGTFDDLYREWARRVMGVRG